jgi:flagellar protein FlaG
MGFLEEHDMEIAPLQSGSAPVLVDVAAPVDANVAAQNRELIQAVKAVNASEMLGTRSELTFSIDRQTQRLVVRLVDKETKDVIRQYPPEYVLRLAEDISVA